MELFPESQRSFLENKMNSESTETIAAIEYG